MNATISRLTSPLARIAAALAAVAGIASCGGGVSANPSPVVNDTAITILPATAVLFSGMPTTFVLSGGTGSYIVASSNQAIVPFTGGVTGRSITIVPNPVTADTTVTLTVRDTGAAVPVTATLTVKPGTVNNDITITRTSTITGCTGVALCSGGDAEVTVTLSQGGIPLAARGVQFSVVSGDFRFITTVPGTTPETLGTSIATVTDQSGMARVRIRILAFAANQTAQMQVTDLGSGAFQRTSFVIAQVTTADPSFYTVPAGLAFIGPRQGECASASSNFFVYGGTPPYTISNTSQGFGVAPGVVAANGGSFTVATTGGPCSTEGTSATILVTDSMGRVRSVLITNKPTTDVLPPLVVAPDKVTLATCTTVASFSVAGGTGSYLMPSTGSDLIDVTQVVGGTVSVSRRPNTPVGSTDVPPSVSIGVSDGISVATVAVDLIGAAAARCP